MQPCEQANDSTEIDLDSSCVKKPGPSKSSENSQGACVSSVKSNSGLNLMCERPTTGKETTSLVIVIVNIIIAPVLHVMVHSAYLRVWGGRGGRRQLSPILCIYDCSTHS